MTEVFSEAMITQVYLARTLANRTKCERAADEAIRLATLAALRTGETYWLDSGLAEAIDAASHSLPDDVQLYREMLPSKAGFVWSRDHIPVMGGVTLFFREEEMTVHGFVWMSMDSTIRGRQDQEHIEIASDRPSTILGIIAKVGSRFTIPRFMAWPEDTPLDQVAALKDPRASPGVETCMLSKFFVSLVLFIQQRIAVTTTRVAPRHVQRQLKRQCGAHNPIVKVIELRAREYQYADAAHADPSIRDYSVQWIVRGHWRNQWYPSLGRHQPKWISPYVKGPKDKPLKTPRASVFAVVR